MALGGPVSTQRRNIKEGAKEMVTQLNKDKEYFRQNWIKKNY